MSYTSGGGFASSYGSYGASNANNGSTDSGANAAAGGFASYGSYGNNGAATNYDSAQGGNDYSRPASAGGAQGGTTTSFGSGEQTVTSLSLGQVREVKSDDNNQHELNGKRITIVAVVGRVVEFESTSTYKRITLDDGEDKMEVRIWNLNDDIAEDGSAPSGGNNAMSASSVDAIQEGSHIKVFGHIRNFKDLNNIVALSIKTIENPKEIEYHRLLVKFTQLYMKNGPLADSNPVAGNQFQANTGNSAAAQAAGGFGGNDDLSPIQKDVQVTIQKYQPTMSGASITDIMTALRSKYSEDNIRASVNFLYSEGHIYSTVDEEHYKSASL